MPEVASAFREYADWLSAYAGPAKASRLILRHLSFFLEIEKRWAAVPTPEVLLKAFGTAWLRRSLLATQFIAERSGAPLSAVQKAETAEAARIERALDGLPLGTPALAVLSSYRVVLMTKHRAGRMKVRSVRLALTAAKGLILASADSPRGLPEQAAMDTYLRARPGQRAALAGFVSHLRRDGGAELRLPKKPGLGSAKARSKVEGELRGLLAITSSQSNCGTKLLALALRHFHGVPRKTAIRFGKPSALKKYSGRDWCIEIEGRRFWVPVEVAMLCQRGGGK